MAAADRKALLVATYDYRDPGLRRLTAPAHDAEALAEVLQDPDIAGFEVSTLVNQPAHVVGEAIADFYRDCRRDDLTLLYFSGHGVKDDEGRLYLAMSNTRRDALLFTGLSAAQINDAMDACVSRRKVLVLDCCYSGAFPAGHTAKGDDSVHTLERFQGKGRAVLTASDSTQYSFEGETVAGRGTRSLFTRFLVEAIRTGEADLDADGDIALDELYSYVHDRVVATMPQQRPKKQEDVDGRIVLARNVHWTLPAHLRNAIDSPIAAQRLAAVDELAHLHRVGNEIVRAAVARELAALADDDSRAVSAAAVALSTRLGGSSAPSSVPPPRAAPAPESHAAPESVAAAAVGGGSPEPEADVAEEHATGAPAAPSPVAVSSPVAASSPVPRTAVAPAVEGPGAAEAAAGRHSRTPLLIALIAVAAGLLVASRFMVFEGTNGYSALSLGWSTPNWFVQVALPFLVAVGVLLAGRGSLPAATEACGVLAGVVLSLVSQLIMSGLVVWSGDVGYSTGPGWWALLAGAVVLAGAVTVGVSRQPRMRDRPQLRRDGWAAGGLVVVLAGTLGSVLMGPVSSDYGWWQYLRVPELLLAACCLCLTGLRLSAGQRRLSLAAVTAFGAWLAEMAVEALTDHRSGAQPVVLLVSLLTVVLWVVAAYVVQMRPRAQEPRPVTTG